MNKDYAEKLAYSQQESNISQQAGIVNCEASRQKYWSELKEHERIDRLREVIKRYEQRLEIAEAFIHSMMEHKHGPDGSLVGPFNPHNHMPQYAKASYPDGRADTRGPDDIYF